MQLKAGYIIDAIGKVITDYKSNLNRHNPPDQIKLDQINGLLQYVSSFDVEFPPPYQHYPDFKTLKPVLATLNNIITRGLPTRAPIILENLFSEINLIESKIDDEFNYPVLKKEIPFDTIFQLLHILEPKLEISENQYGGLPGSFSEWKFLDVALKDFPFAKQIFQSQRDLATIGNGLAGGRTLDFSFEFPYLITNSVGNLTDKQKQGIVFEFDGPHHQLKTVKYFDNYRDEFADENNFETLRQSFNEIGLNPDIKNQFRNDIFTIFKTNYNRDIETNLTDYSLIFIPLSVARIQKTIIEFLLVNSELFTKPKINIAIIERDFPCGAIAIKSLQELFFNINAILEEKDKLLLPEISLTIFENSKWVINDKLHLQAVRKDENFFKENQFDIIIDHAILRRANIYKETDFQNNNAIKIRSSHYYDNSFGNERRVYCAELLNYKALVEKRDDGSYKPIPEFEKNINFFIQNIFRKVSFRDGQLPIISRALQQKPVIGLLPTGGGKSLTFQLPAFLQPGLCLVVDPIKSLMEDQVRVLKKNWIDCCDFINSNLKKREEKAKKLIDFRLGETMFLFISPERFVMEDFRNIIKKIDVSKFGLAFSYCVIDEVHCVSEWGHDFRSTYLMLGKNCQEFAKTRSDKKKVSLIGLTATASFDVLADIERELQIDHSDVADAIIMIENTIRPELFFRVIDVTGTERMSELNNDFTKIAENLDKINRDINIVEQSLSHHYIEFENLKYGEFDTGTERYILNDDGKCKINSDAKKIKLEIDFNNTNPDNFSTIIFCPTKGNKRNNNGKLTDEKGVPFVFEKLMTDKKGFFYATDTDELNNEVQDYFEKFTSDKSEIKHIICTKAFGMGIDKKDIRSTYHYFYSSSLESLVQEAGRSGRDKKISEANILVSKSSYIKLDVYKFFSENKEHELIKNKYTRKAIRYAFEKRWNERTRNYDIISFSSMEEILNALKLIDFSLPRNDGGRYNILSVENINALKNILIEKHDENSHKFILEKHKDREIHNYFHQISFKGVDTERSQLRNLFKVKEFQPIKGEMVNIEGQETLAKEFENCEKEKFQFIITAEKKYPNASEKICNLIGVNPTNPINPSVSTKTFQEVVKTAHDYSNDFNDFLFLLEENSVINLSLIGHQTKEKLLFVYSRDREVSNDTGRLIYRMHSMGFLENYLIDYNKNNLYSCTFRKFGSIDEYTEIIEKYLRRYLSENEALNAINTKKDELERRLSKPTLIDNILEWLYFLAEFSYKEIASKRKRATDEIEAILNTSITDPKYATDWYQQNIYIKEQIYFYFNAKYARIGFKINGEPYSLLEHHRANINTEKDCLSKNDILTRYLEVYQQKDGTEQNNYKHMMGSCKKILGSLIGDDLNNEWLLHLLKAFAMYSVNNASYISEANTELERGFDNLHRVHQNDFEIIEPIFENYFKKLQSNIQPDNSSFKDIELIRLKLLLKMQIMGIEEFVNGNQGLNILLNA